eukprot:TRINITY_DN102436_c0_g1_i1.p1 TRINITY_DN102436_c0_g1~~TRINITY_DN102436_c0_g1_i1.p1  ORF type:complete len:518 (-),score=94.80 TRINITY_DN102436_c0_g1_i1:237-1790(-)
MAQSVSTAGCGAVESLVLKYKQLVLDEGRVDTTSEHGLDAAKVFLESLEEAAVALKLPPASRSYRAEFTTNYRGLFPDESRNYRLDILEGSLEQNGFIWVNGDKFEFDTETMLCAATLERCWSNCLAILCTWNGSEMHHASLGHQLQVLDTAWADFERRYINELIKIEVSPRQLLVVAIELEQKLQDFEIEHGRQAAVLLPEYIETQGDFIRSIAHLNSRANCRRKGRDDLSVEILWDAVKTLQMCDAAERNGDSPVFLTTARVLCKSVVSSFLAMRGYLRAVSTCLEEVNPQLCKNKGLVNRLCAWEESWEVGQKYIKDKMVLTGICDLVAGLRQAQRIVPGFKSMCEDRDAEVFTVLPGIIWLQGLAKPGRSLHLFRSLLPHRFVSIQATGGNGQEQWPCDPELNAFIDHFRSTHDLLVRDQFLAGESYDPSFAWKVIVKRVALGSETKDTYGSQSLIISDRAEEALETFMKKMGAWSMEIQRHCAEEWNQLVQIVLCSSFVDKGQDLNESSFVV